MADLINLIDGRAGWLSIDADFFRGPDEESLASDLEHWLAQRSATGVRFVARTDHVDLVGLMAAPVEVLLNLDFHMDVSLEFLLGGPAHVPAQDATVFETLLESALIGRYVWLHPARRRSDAARVYATAAATGRQPLLPRMHCIPAPQLMELLARMDATMVFLCRSPGYATETTERVFRRLEAIGAGWLRAPHAL